MDCIVAEDNGLDGSSSGGKRGEENANVSSKFRVGKEGEEFLSCWGEGFGHFVKDPLDLFHFLIGGQELLGVSEVLLWFP